MPRHITQVIRIKQEKRGIATETKVIVLETVSIKEISKNY